MDIALILVKLESLSKKNGGVRMEIPIEAVVTETGDSKVEVFNPKVYNIRIVSLQGSVRLEWDQLTDDDVLLSKDLDIVRPKRKKAVVGNWKSNGDLKFI